MMIYKWLTSALIAAVLLPGCENDDSPMQPGNCTVTVVNATRSAIHVAYQTQTWDVLWPVVDVAHEATTEIKPGSDVDLVVHFDNELGTSRIQVVKAQRKKNYVVRFGRQTLRVSEEDFAGK